MNSLEKAVRAKDISRVDQLLRNGTKPTARAVNMALMFGYEKIVNLFLNRDVELNHKTLESAVLGSPSKIDRLLKAGVQPTTKALGWAVYKENLGAFDRLVKAGVQPTEETLEYAIDYDCVYSVNHLLALGIKAKSNNLINAAAMGHMNIVLRLIVAGLEPDRDVFTAHIAENREIHTQFLEWALEHGNFEYLHKFLQFGGDKNGIFLGEICSGDDKALGYIRFLYDTIKGLVEETADIHPVAILLYPFVHTYEIIRARCTGDGSPSQNQKSIDLVKLVKELSKIRGRSQHVKALGNSPEVRNHILEHADFLSFKDVSDNDMRRAMASVIRRAKHRENIKIFYLAITRLGLDIVSAIPIVISIAGNGFDLFALLKIIVVVLDLLATVNTLSVKELRQLSSNQSGKDTIDVHINVEPMLQHTDASGSFQPAQDETDVNLKFGPVLKQTEKLEGIQPGQGRIATHLNFDPMPPQTSTSVGNQLPAEDKVVTHQLNSDLVLRQTEESNGNQFAGDKVVVRSKSDSALQQTDNLGGNQFADDKVVVQLNPGTRPALQQAATSGGSQNLFLSTMGLGTVARQPDPYRRAATVDKIMDGALGCIGLSSATLDFVGKTNSWEATFQLVVSIVLIGIPIRAFYRIFKFERLKYAHVTIFNYCLNGNPILRKAYGIREVLSDLACCIVWAIFFFILQYHCQGIAQIPLI